MNTQIKKLLAALAFALSLSTTASAAKVGDTLIYSNADLYGSHTVGEGNYGNLRLTVPASADLPAGSTYKIKSVTLALRSGYNKAYDYLVFGQGSQYANSSSSQSSTADFCGKRSLTYTYTNDSTYNVGESYIGYFRSGSGGAVVSGQNTQLAVFARQSGDPHVLQQTNAGESTHTIVYEVTIEVVSVPAACSATVSTDTKWSDIVWDPVVADPSKAVLHLTVTDGAVITMDEDPVFASLNITGTMKVDTSAVDGNDLAKYAVVGAPYSYWLVNGKVTGTVVASAVPEVPAGYSIAEQSVAGCGARLIVTAPASAKFEAVSLNLHNGTALESTEALSGLYPVARKDWGNLQASASGSTTVGDVTFALSSNATGWNITAANAKDPIQAQYLDDGQDRTTTMTITGVPYDEYRLIVYYSTDTADYPFQPLQVNGTWYSGETEKVNEANHTVKGKQAFWGHSGPKDSAYAVAEGVNALTTDVLTGDATLSFIRPTATFNARATIAAIQVVKVGDVVDAKIFSATIYESKVFNEIQWDAGASFKEGKNNEATVTVDSDSGEEVEITFNDPDLLLGKLEIVSDDDVKFTADRPLPNVGQFVVTGCTAKVTYNWPVDSLQMTTDGSIAYTGGAGSADAAASIAFVPDGDLTLDGRDGEAQTYYLGRTYRGDANPYTMSFINASVACLDSTGFTVGKGTVTMSGMTTVEAGSFVLSKGAANLDANVAIMDDAAVSVTGGSNVDANDASIILGRYAGPSTLTLQDNATFTAEDAQVLVGRAGNVQTINLDGGTFKAKGIKASANATGTNTLNLNGGALELGDVGITSYGTTTIDVNVTEDSTITALGDSLPITQPLAVAEGKTLTLAATSGDIVVSGAVTCDGTIEVADGNVVFMPSANVDLTKVSESGGSAIYGFTVGINDLGQFRIPTGCTAEKIKLFDRKGEPVDITASDDDYVYFDWKYTDGACWWDYEFDGNGDNTGSDSTKLSWDDNRPFKDDEFTGDGALRIPSRPWRNVSSWPSEVTFVFYGKMVGTDKAYQIAFGSKNDSGNQLFLATKSAQDGTVDLCYSVNGAAPSVLCTMTVPCAQTANHLYAVVLKDDGTGNTVVNTYLDGELLQPYTHEGALTLGAGFQIASGHGGVAAGGYGRPADDDPATMDWLRVYDVELNADAMARLAEIYPYESTNGKATRTVTSADAAWVADGAWQQKQHEAETLTTNAPFANTSVEVTVDGAATLAMNLDEAANYEALEIKGAAALTLTGAADAVVPGVSGMTTIGTDVTVAHDAITFGNVTVEAGKTLTFDFASLDLAKEFSNRSIKLTGTVKLGAGAAVESANVPKAERRTAEFVYDESTQQYSLTITVDTSIPFVYENDEWSWDGKAVDAEVVSNSVEQGIVVWSDLLWPIDRSSFTVRGGTLKAAGATGRTATVTVENGATFDFNGSKDGLITINLGGTLLNTGDSVSTGSKQMQGLALTADSTVGGTGDFGLVARDWEANVLDLGGKTLTKTGANAFYLCNTTVSNGTFVVTGGTLRATGVDSAFADNASLALEAGTTLALDAGLSIGEITSQGATINNAGVISSFTLNGTATFAGSITGVWGWGTNTLNGATVDVGTLRDFAFEGSGTVNVTISDAERAAYATVTVFTTTSGDLAFGTVKDAAGNALTQDKDYEITAAGVIKLKDPRVALEGVSIPETLEVALGAVKKIPLVITPADATLDTVDWVLYNMDGEIEVDAQGNVTGVKAGDAIVTVYVRDVLGTMLDANCTVTVTDAPPAPEPVVPGEGMEIPAGSTVEDFIATVNGNKATLLAAPDGVLEGEALTEYQGLFTAALDGTVVKFVLNEAGTNAVNAATATAKATALDVALSEDATLLIEGEDLLPGFYYSLKQAADILSLDFKSEGDRNKLAGRDAVEFTLEKPESAGFYQTIVTPTEYAE